MPKQRAVRSWYLLVLRWVWLALYTLQNSWISKLIKTPVIEIRLCVLLWMLLEDYGIEDSWLKEIYGNGMFRNASKFTVHAIIMRCMHLLQTKWFFCIPACLNSIIIIIELWARWLRGKHMLIRPNESNLKSCLYTHHQLMIYNRNKPKKKNKTANLSTAWCWWWIINDRIIIIHPWKYFPANFFAGEVLFPYVMSIF